MILSKPKRLLFWLLLPLLMIGSFVRSETVAAKELTKAISNVVIWDILNNAEAKKSGGSYVLTEDVTYAWRLNFDLAAYDGQMENGDYFTVTISEPVTLVDSEFEVKEDKTGANLPIADVKVTSKGAGKGGTVTFTLKNLETYLQRRGEVTVTDIRGYLFANFSSKATNNLTVPVTLDRATDGTTKTIHMLVLKRGVSDYSGTIAAENYAKLGGVYAEKAYDSAILGKSGTHVHPWRIRVNASKKTYNTLTITDTIGNDSAPMQIIPESLRIRSSTVGFNPVSFALERATFVQENVDYTVTYNATYTQMEIKLLNVGDKIFLIEYDTTAPGGGLLVGNTAVMDSDGTRLVNNTINRRLESALYGRISGAASGGQVMIDASSTISVVKIDEATRQPLAGAVFTVKKPDGTIVTLPPTNNRGIAQSPKFTAEEMRAGQFTITEVQAPKHYDLDPTPVEVTLTSQGISRTFTNKRRETITFEAKKVWDDAEDQDGKRPQEVILSLVDAGGTEIEQQTATAATGWKVTFEADKFDTQGNEITYQIRETPVAGYDAPVVSGDVTQGFTVTNKRTPETRNHQVKKIWDDASNQDGKRPENVTFQLYQSIDGAEATPVAGQTVTLDQTTATDTNTWAAVFAGLPRYVSGKEITYSAKETQVPAGYTALTETVAHTTTVTNTYRPERLADVLVTKVWKDADNQDGKRPTAVRVTLQKTVGGATTPVETRELTGTNWSTTFTDLPKYESGQLIAYGILEESVAGYTSSVTGDVTTGFTVTNAYTPEVRTIAGVKTWDDANNQDGKRPEKISVKLKANGEEVASLDVSAATGWSYQFTDVPTYQNGVAIDYTIEEEPVAGYSSQKNGFNLTNTYTPETTDVKVTKVWNDADNQDGKRPDQVTIKLMKTVNGTTSQVRTAELTAPSWETILTGLPVYEAGQKITYSVAEDVSLPYTASVDGFIITNSYSPEKVAYKVTKIWEDGNNRDGKRPDAITVQLYKSINGQAATPVAGQTVLLTVANQVDKNTWEATFTNLPRYESGQEINYSVKEDDETIALLTGLGYTASVNGQQVTNKYTPETVKLLGVKIWEDDHNKDGKRPEVITVKIMNGTSLVQEIQVSEATNWTFSSIDLPKYAAGQVIDYTVEEVAVEGYTSQQTRDADGKYILTNTYRPTPPSSTTDSSTFSSTTTSTDSSTSSSTSTSTESSTSPSTTTSTDSSTISSTSTSTESSTSSSTSTSTESSTSSSTTASTESSTSLSTTTSTDSSTSSSTSTNTDSSTSSSTSISTDSSTSSSTLPSTDSSTPSSRPSGLASRTRPILPQTGEGDNIFLVLLGLLLVLTSGVAGLLSKKYL